MFDLVITRLGNILFLRHPLVLHRSAGVNGVEIPSTPVRLPEGKPRIQLNQAMEVSEQKVPREHDEILRLTKEVRCQLDHFGYKDPAEEV